MGFIDRLNRFFGGRDESDTMQNTSAMEQMREAMELARIARRSEAYDQAYAALETAMQIADAQKDTHSITVIALHQADVLIEQGNYDDAEKLLQTVQQTAESVNQQGFMSYALTSIGNLQRGRGNWTAAQNSYEQARDIAVKAGALGPEGRALGFLADVYLHNQNASYAIHLLEECLPKLEAASDLDLSSYFVGRLGDAMIAAGQVNDGRFRIDRALKLAEQMRDQAMIRRWTIRLGDTAYDTQKYDEAALFYERAKQYLNEKPDQPDYPRVLTRLSQIKARTGNQDEALALAEEAMQYVNPDDNSAHARTQGALGMALRALGRNAEAVTYLKAAVENASDEVDPLYIESLRQLAAAQLDAGQHETALETYQRSLKLAQDANLTIPAAQTYRDIGLYHTKHDNLRDAIEAWAQALSIFENERDTNQIARLYCDLGNARRRLGQTKRAMTDYENALVALNHVDDLATRGLILANAANAYTDQGDTESASAFFREAIDIARKIDDQTSESTRLGNYGWFLIATGEPRKAIEKLTKALEISRENNLTLHSAIQTDNLGLAYDNLSQYKTALGYHEDAIKLIQSLNPTPTRWVALFKANTARTKISLGRIDDAANDADEALQLARDSGDFEVIIIALLSAGRVNLRQSKLTEATTLIQEGLSLAGRASLRRLQAEAYHLLSEQQAASERKTDAQKSWEEAKRLYRMIGAPQAKTTPFWIGNSPPEEGA